MLPAPPMLVTRLHKQALVPARMSAGSAGLDLAACLPDHTVMRIEPGERAAVPTGIALAIPPGYEGQVRPRSGLARKHGISIPNAPGTIDADYRGELVVLLINLGAEAFDVHHGDRIAQLVIAPVAMCPVEVVTKLPETARGDSGFGSTGV